MVLPVHGSGSVLSGSDQAQTLRVPIACHCTSGEPHQLVLFLSNYGMSWRLRCFRDLQSFSHILFAIMHHFTRTFRAGPFCIMLDKGIGGLWWEVEPTMRDLLLVALTPCLELQLSSHPILHSPRLFFPLPLTPSPMPYEHQHNTPLQITLPSLLPVVRKF